MAATNAETELERQVQRRTAHLNSLRIPLVYDEAALWHELAAMLRRRG
jgi:hypothetical protein